jgi:hypothetical protein
MSSKHKAKVRQRLSGWPENNDVRDTREIKSSAVMAKSAFNKNTTHQQIALTLQKQVMKC